MPSTTIHINDDVLASIDRVAGERGVSRNRFIVEACKTALQSLSTDWPEGFFDSHHSKRGMSLLQEAASEMEESIRKLRRNRGDLDL
jgi:metal-responsive CopG/Arc/MetJ family transcriptional regulator